MSLVLAPPETEGRGRGREGGREGGRERGRETGKVGRENKGRFRVYKRDREIILNCIYKVT